MYWVDNLKIKCMIFLTLIICSSTFFLSSVEAATYDLDVMYNKSFGNFSNEQVLEMIDYLKTLEDDYYVVLSYNAGYMYVYVDEKTDVNYTATFKYASSTYIYFSLNNPDGKCYSIDFNSNFSSNLATLKNNVANKITDTNGYTSGKEKEQVTDRYTTLVLLYSNVDFKISKTSGYYVQSGGVDLANNSIIPSWYDNYLLSSLSLKKENSYNSSENNGNSLKYIDIYFNKENFQKKIKYELNFNDYNSEIESAFEFELAEISSFEIAYLIKDENSFYKWIKNNDIGVYIDHDTSSIPKNDGTGFELTGVISLIYDDSVYSNIEQIKVSIGFSSAFNYSYSYYDNSNVTENDIDDYYSNMLGVNGRLYRNKQYDKYSVISTKQEMIKDTILVEYINTDYHLYLEYFDTNLGSYIESSMLVTSDYFLIKNRDFEKYQYKIGTSIEKGLYLMNYLYHNNNKNIDSYYWFYVSLGVEYYNTNYLDESYYYDNNGEIDQNIIQNPNSETDNIKFSDTFRPFFGLVDDLEATRILFNDSFKIIYYSLPRMITLCLELLCHAICMAVLLQMLGWGDY